MSKSFKYFFYILTLFGFLNIALADTKINQAKRDVVIGGIKVEGRLLDNPAIKKAIEGYQKQLKLAQLSIQAEQDCDVTDEEYGETYDSCSILDKAIREIELAQLDQDIAEIKAVDTELAKIEAEQAKINDRLDKDIAEQAQRIERKKTIIAEQAQRIHRKQEAGKREDMKTAHEKAKNADLRLLIEEAKKIK